MISLRPYKKEDANTIVGWISDEKAFRLWCADRFKSFPLTTDEFDSVYSQNNTQLSGFVLTDGETTVGHLFMQVLNDGKCKFGLIVVDNTKRGNGYGRQMLEMAFDYAKKVLKATHVTLSVFDNNISAYKCYKNLGFSETGKVIEYTFFGEKHKYIELERNI